MMNLKKFHKTPTPDSVILHKPKEKPRVSVTINWKDAISVEDFKKGLLTSKEENIAQTDKVIYIFVGYRKKNEGKAVAVDVGQTERTLATRTEEHTAKKDYLEGYPHDQIVYTGEVQCVNSVDSTLLNQIEGIIIQYIDSHNKGFTLCNDSKRSDFKKSYDIIQIENKNRKGDLTDLLPSYLSPK